MKIALATDDNRGLEAVLSHHFGRCPYYVLVDIDDNEIKKVDAVQNPFYESHGQAGEVPTFINSLGAQVIIAGGMGPKAIGFFEQFGIEAITGVSGMVREAIKAYMSGQIEGAKPCSDNDVSHHIEPGNHDEATRLKEEMVALRRELAKATERLKRLEEEKKEIGSM
jgi:predicted Fe-Mo cluster-binding NifX family protein